MSAADHEINTSSRGSRKRQGEKNESPRKQRRLGQGTSDQMHAAALAKKRIQGLLKATGQGLMKQNTFVYPPLKEGKGQEIRVLVIEPGNQDDPMRCRLVPSALPKSETLETKAYHYTALSYYWGDSEPIHPVTITNYITPNKRTSKPSGLEMVAFKARKHNEWRESGEIIVRSHLYVALQRFRKKRKRAFMWIDALCIDQNDAHERSAQVKQMHELYIQAEKVNIWLGDGSSAEGSPKACFDFLKRILDLQSLGRLLDDLAGGNADIKENARHVIGLMCNKWFSRRWVLQELALAREADVVYGKKKMLWSDFADAIAIFIKSQESIGPILAGMVKKEASSVSDLQLVDDVKNLGANVLVDFINNLFRRAENGDIQHRMMDLESLVSNLLAFEATNPRDTIYAVLSLAKDTHSLSTERNKNAAQLSLDPRLLPAYQSCLLDVYTDFLDYCIHRSKSLDILLRHWAPAEKLTRPTLRLARTNPAVVETSGESNDLPTWIPLIQKSSHGTPHQRIQGRSNGDGFVGASGRNRQRNYNATMDLKPKKKFEKISYPSSVPETKRPRKYSGKLFIKGLRIGTVEQKTQRAARGMLFKEFFEMAGFQHESWLADQEWSDGMSRVPEAFWRTIVADRGPDGGNPPAWYQRACYECLNIGLRPNGDLRPDDVIDLPNAPDITKSFLDRVKAVVWERTIILVQLDGYEEKPSYGLAPTDTKEGDIICVFFGCSVPVVLREHHDGNTKYFLMIGECFVYGMMDGEAVGGKKWTHPFKDAELFELR